VLAAWMATLAQVALDSDGGADWAKTTKCLNVAKRKMLKIFLLELRF
jgi:hypothetical protein